MPWKPKDWESANSIIERYDVPAQDLNPSRTTSVMDNLQSLFDSREQQEEISRLVSLLDEQERMSDEYSIAFDFLNYLLAEVSTHNRK